MDSLISVVSALFVIVLILGTIALMVKYKKQTWPIKHLWVGLLILATAVVIYFLAHASSLEAYSAGEVWAFTKKYWMWILIPIGLVYLLLSVMPTDKGMIEKAGKAQKALVALAAILFVGMPLVHLAWGEKPTSQQLQQACAPYSSTSVGHCLVTEEGVNSSPDEPIPENEFELCYVRPAGTLLEINWVGSIVQFRSGKGNFQLLHKMIKRTKLVNGKCPDTF